MSIRQAAGHAGISEARWRQIEHGIRYFRGDPYPETGPAQTVAAMARVVGASPAQLIDAGRADAAGELEALVAAVGSMPGLTGRQRDKLAGRIKRDSSD